MYLPLFHKIKVIMEIHKVTMEVENSTSMKSTYFLLKNGFYDFFL